MADQYGESDTNHPDTLSIVEYLKTSFPNLSVFVAALGEQLYNIKPSEIDDDSSVTNFVFGAVISYALLARHAEMQALGE